MRRVVILGPGGSGKSTLALRICSITGLPVIELDKVFWGPELVPSPPEQWAALQQRLCEGKVWIMDGDLGPHDIVEIRLRAADTIIFLDFSLVRCAWRAVRRSRERVDFWLWLFQYRRKSRPLLFKAIAQHATRAKLYVVRTPKALERLVAKVARDQVPSRSR